MSNPGTTVRGILFDKDGTLIDYHASFMPLNWALAETLAGGDGAVARRLMVAGGWDPETDRMKPGSPLAADTNREIAELLAREIGTDDVETVYATVLRAFDRSVEIAVAVTDLRPLLGELKRMDIRLGISTSDHTSAARETVDRFDLADIMDFVAGYDAGYGGKPAPGMIEGFCRENGLTPETVMVVGDNRHDVEFARAGGAGWAVGVLTGTSGREDLEPIADFVLDDVAQLPALIAGLDTGAPSNGGKPRCSP